LQKLIVIAVWAVSFIIFRW